MEAGLFVRWSFQRSTSGFSSRLLAPTCARVSARHASGNSFNRPKSGRKDPKIPGRRSIATNRAYIGLGSNVGDRVKAIEDACKKLNEAGLTVKRTSSLYETAPMYVENQDEFLNGVCEVEVEESLSPLELLHRVKQIENDLGRHKTIDKGPRNIDLDIELYGDRSFENHELSIPHHSLLEREFVLRPLCDLIPLESHPQHPGRSFREHLDALPEPNSPTSTYTPLSSRISPLRSFQPTRSTQLMAILNITPNSFSDGGLHKVGSESLVETIREFLGGGASIIDVGGQSTAPGVPQVGPEEELRRVIPVINLIRSHSEFDSAAISVDTYHAPVARAAIEAGADLVNDISAGTLDRTMLPTVAELGCSIVLMHMRGNPVTMMQMADYSGDLVRTVASELQERLAAAERAGIPRWRIVLDPGLGFAKKDAQNLELLRRLDELRGAEGLKGYPWLVGPSRKSLIGRVTGVQNPSDRTWGTAAAVSASVQGGADIVRIHDVKEMSYVVTMAEAIWRG